ncbi:DUF2029 domain-containing protein [bacterium]|nr:DUF2029 domain-containing protein [bacterium]
MKRLLPWVLLVIAAAQFLIVALPPGNDDLISIQSLALDFDGSNTRLLYPGKNFALNDPWIAHHETNLRRLGGSGEPNWCFYPPLIPYLLSPVAGVSAETWRIVWGMMQLVFVVLYALLIRRLLQSIRPCGYSCTVIVFALVLGSFPLARSLELGQTSLLVAVLLWAGIIAALTGRTIWRRTAVGVAAVLKPFLLLVEVPEIAERKFTRATASLAVWFGLMLLALILLGWTVHRSYLDFLVTLGSSQTAYSGNQSLLAGVMRLFSDWPVTDYGFGQERGWLVLGRFISVVVLAVAAWAQFRGMADVISSVGLWLSAALIALPISWEHHLLLLLPVIAWLWATTDDRPSRLFLGVATLLLSVCWTPLYGEDGIRRMAASLPLFGNVVLFVLLIHTRVRGAKAAPRPA